MFHVGGLTSNAPALHAGALVTLHRRTTRGGDDARRPSCGARPTLAVSSRRSLPALVSHSEWSATDLRACARSPPARRSCHVTSSTPSMLAAFRHPGLWLARKPRRSPSTRPVPRRSPRSGPAASRRCMRGQIVDAEGRDVTIGERGEILIRGRNVMIGFGATRRPHFGAARRLVRHRRHRASGWRRGIFTSTSGKNDVIISGGENIYPRR